MSTTAWSPLFLTLVALCTGDWMGGQGKGLGKTHRPGSVLSCLDPRVTLSVSPPSRIRAEAVLTQPPSVPGTLGQRVPISCTGNRSNTGGHYVSWHQQLPGSAHRLLTRENSKRLSGVPDRFSVSKSGKLASLTTSVQAEDNTDYYCFSWADGLKVHGASGQRGRRQKPASPTARGSQGKVFDPPFLGSLRARNPAVCMSPDCSTAAPSVGRPSRGQRLTRVVTHPWMKELLTAVAPGSQVGISSTEQGVSAALAGSVGSERTSLTFRHRRIS